MTTTLKDTIFRFWDSNIEKYGLDNYQTDFVRFVGTNSSSNEYNNILATLVNKIKERPKNVLCFDNDIPMEINFNIAQSIKSELATMDNAQQNQQTFGMVKNSYIRLVDEVSNNEIARYELKEDFSTETAVLFGQLEKDSAQSWHFHTLGEGKVGDLSALAMLFG
jgi:uncharacterized protein YigA (DUF484 family)